MDELSPNPDGCVKFEPNPFKKEKCKNCGNLWTQHKGIIDAKLVDGYMKAKQKVIEDKQRVEAEAKQKALAKKLEKKKRDQAAEDEWLFDGTKTPLAVDEVSDDDFGFKMFSQEDLACERTMGREKSLAASASGDKPLKVTNLIDWGECNVPDETSSSSCAAALPESQDTFSRPRKSTSVGADDGHFSAGASSTRPSVVGPPPGLDLEAELEAENRRLQGDIDHLRLMLASANEEKNIQVEIVQDELKERQKRIEELEQENKTAKESQQLVATDELAAKQKRIEELEEEINRAKESQQLVATDELAAKQRRIEELEEENKKAKESQQLVATDELAAKQRRIEELEEERRMATEAQMAQQKRIEELEEENKNVREAQQVLITNELAAKQRIVELEEENKKVQETHQLELAAVRAEADQQLIVTDELTVKQKRIQELEEENRKTKETHQLELTAARTEADQLRADLVASRGEAALPPQSAEQQEDTAAEKPIEAEDEKPDVVVESGSKVEAESSVEAEDEKPDVVVESGSKVEVESSVEAGEEKPDAGVENGINIEAENLVEARSDRTGMHVDGGPYLPADQVVLKLRTLRITAERGLDELRRRMQNIAVAPLH